MNSKQPVLRIPSLFSVPGPAVTLIPHVQATCMDFLLHLGGVVRGVGFVQYSILLFVSLIFAGNSFQSPCDPSCTCLCQGMYRTIFVQARSQGEAW